MNKLKWIALGFLVVVVTTGARFAAKLWQQPAYVPRKAARASDLPAMNIPAADGTPQSEHPLDPALKIARACLAHMEESIRDYSATMIKQEQVDGKVTEPEQMFVKIRQQPFSVYLYFNSPENLKGQEVAYIEGKNGGNMQARGVGLQALLGVVSLKPDGPIAMLGQRYPIYEIGILNLTQRLIEAAEEGKQHDECEVTFRKDAKINDRPCTCIEVVHPTKRPYFNFYKARVFIDDELNIPVRYEAYEWPDKPGGEPKLIEQYTYIDVKLNNGFTDADFELK